MQTCLLLAIILLDLVCSIWEASNSAASSHDIPSVTVWSVIDDKCVWPVLSKYFVVLYNLFRF